MQLLVFSLLFCWIGVVVWARAQKPARCDPRYFQHYWMKVCEPVFGPGDPKCPVRFICPESIPEDRPGCKLGDNYFYFRQNVPSDDPCKTCICGEGWYGKPTKIVCKDVGCSPDCYESYGKDICFSTYKLWGVPGPPQPICKHQGKTYLFGEKMSFDEDPCLECTCHEGWTGQPERDSQCTRNRCDSYFEYSSDDKKRMEAGCLPVYEEEICCPIYYDCGKLSSMNLQAWSTNNTIVENGTTAQLFAVGNPPMSNVARRTRKMAARCLSILFKEGMRCPLYSDCGDYARNTTTPLATDDEIESGDSCVFNGSHYQIGQLLHIHPNNCVKCECVTPPEFTCVGQTCPSPYHSAESSRRWRPAAFPSTRENAAPSIMTAVTMHQIRRHP
ncbi:hypothetical protein JTE90_022698 [Oedothorax gibbosus]|uniref:VWFC domain-containing protein n=1 Tax=Oedothorax gibbosus TaxID=931172 RepID=A0AAV6UJQ8_9ARAC|nr:hypothetical protein JTE90_022698 [Oedothorax gibbosus]